MSKNATKLQVGIAGLGKSGWDIHADAFGRLSSLYTVSAVSDPRAERLAEAAERFGCRTYESVDALFADADLDLVVVATPSHMHVQHAIAALKAGHHVLIEKPIAADVDEVDAIARQAASADRIAAPFQNRRYDPIYLKVKEVIDSGVLGRIVQVRMGIHGFSRRWDWQTLKKFNGGSLNNTGPHLLDQALEIFGPDKPEVFCKLDRALTSGDAEDHAKVVLHGPNNPLVEVEITSCCAYPQDNWLVMGTRGGLRGTFKSIEWKWVDFDKLEPRPVETEPSDRKYNREQLTWQEESWEVPEDQAQTPMAVPFYAGLHDAILGNAPLVVTLNSVRRQIEVLSTCHKKFGLDE